MADKILEMAKKIDGEMREAIETLQRTDETLSRDDVTVEEVQEIRRQLGETERILNEILDQGTRKSA
ncbi:hypothetical protein E4U17_003977 [Claviceps sp. LM77 group G4]|nr:hypothetical protein E4U17_003977 [Claviceps sp. LM77 group G4]